uniref:Uncharacterized protein n=1 Tax=Anopheles atroparvus TaxID=41427 RepID=A0AAG5DLY3_ANOAO
MHTVNLDTWNIYEYQNGTLQKPYLPPCGRFDHTAETEKFPTLTEWHESTRLSNANRSAVALHRCWSSHDCRPYFTCATEVCCGKPHTIVRAAGVAAAAAVKRRKKTYPAPTDPPRRVRMKPKRLIFHDIPEEATTFLSNSK